MMSTMYYPQDLNYSFCSQSTPGVSQVAPPEPIPVAQPQPTQPVTLVSSIDRYVKFKFSSDYSVVWYETCKILDH